jgi:hypothetical protein
LRERSAEVVVIPAPASIGTTIEVTITGTRGSARDEKVVIFEVAEGEDDRQEYAEELLDRFVSWLATNHPELGITDDTEWDGTTVSPIWLVVSHYLFFSEEWELHIVACNDTSTRLGQDRPPSPFRRAGAVIRF